MGCDVSPSADRESENSPQSESFVNNGSAERFRIPKSTFKNCNSGVVHASVPRKLRSAMKKRNLEPISRPITTSKKLNRTKSKVQSPKKDGMKKEIQEKKPVSGSITKDEEEVVETLYALARMFPDSDNADKTDRLHNASSVEPKTLPLPEKKEIHPDANKEDLSLLLEVPCPSLAKTEQVDDNKICQDETFDASTKQYLDSGSKQILPKKTALSEEKQEMAFGVKTIENQVAQQKIAGEYTKDGLALWPGLCLTAAQSPGKHNPSKPPAIEIPAWMSVALSPSKPNSEKTNHSMAKVYKLTDDKRSMNRCASHVCIAHLIRDLQISRNALALPHNHVRPQEGSEQRVPNPTTVSDLTPFGNGLTHIMSGGGIVKSSQKQSYDFLSLSAGDGRASTGEARNGSVQLSQTEFLYLDSLPQQHQDNNFSISQPCHVSPASNNQLSAVTVANQAQNRFPSYLSNQMSTIQHSNPLTCSNQHQNRQQRFWATECRPTSAYSISSSPHQSLDPFCPRYNISEQQQRLVAATSSLPATHVINRQEHWFLPVYEETRGGFCANGAPPLQLL